VATHTILNQRNASDGLDVTVDITSDETPPVVHRIVWHWHTGTEPSDVAAAVAERVAGWTPPVEPEPEVEAPSYSVPEDSLSVIKITWPDEPDDTKQAVKRAAQALKKHADEL
jgi:hypothetical protein